MSLEEKNILLITTDEQRYDTLGCTGNKLIKTPNLDKIEERREVFVEHGKATALISGKWKYIHWSQSEECELYNLEKDPFELQTLAYIRKISGTKKISFEPNQELDQGMFEVEPWAEPWHQLHLRRTSAEAHPPSFKKTKRFRGDTLKRIHPRVEPVAFCEGG